MYRPEPEEQKHYNRYSWCLDPMPSWEEMKSRLLEELRRWQRTSDGWQEREQALNCWMMSASLWQTMSDYLIRGSGRMKQCARYAGPLRNICLQSQKIIDYMIQLRNRIYDQRVGALEKEYGQLVELLSRYILCEYSTEKSERKKACQKAIAVMAKNIPTRLARVRIRIPSCFRSMDITHFDVLRMVQSYIDEKKDKASRILVIGLRTAGSFFAPLAKIYMESKGFRNVSCLSIRPKECLSLYEKRAIEENAARNADILIVDEIAHTGSSLKETLRLLNRYGIPEHHIAVAFPVYPVHVQWKEENAGSDFNGVKRYVLPWDRWYIVEKMRPENIRKLLRQYYDNQNMHLVSIEESPSGKQVDDRFGQPERVGWRLKQVYRLKLWDAHGHERYEEIMAKSVGWGWYGYHAFIEAERLHKFVPPLLGLRSGLLFMKWISGRRYASEGASVNDILPEVLKYIFERISTLSLSEDRTFKDYSKKYYGGAFLCSLVGRIFGKRLGRIMRPFIRRLLSCYTTLYPTVIDGKICPQEWIVADGRFWKVDFEHHGFGRTQLNIADPVFDLASFIFEFRLSRKQMEDAIRYYTDYTNEKKVKDKVMLYLWLIAHYNIYNEVMYLSEPYEYKRAMSENAKYLSDQEYMSTLYLEYLSSFIRQPRRREAQKEYVLMDIDRMINKDLWEFPTITMGGIRSISSLRQQGIPFVLKSSRSFDEVKSYCTCLLADGGFAEHGSVLWVRETQQEIVLIDTETREQLMLARQLLKGLPDLHLHPGYRYLVKTFYFKDNAAGPVEIERIREIIEKNELDKLEIIPSDSGTFIAGKSTVKYEPGEMTRQKREDMPAKPPLCLQDLIPDVSMLSKISPEVMPNIRLPMMKYVPFKAGNGSVKSMQPLLVRLMNIAERPVWVRPLSFIGFGHSIMGKQINRLWEKNRVWCR